MWTPNLSDRSGPRYIAIANAIADDIGRKALTPGDKLPPHRELAWQLGVTVGTISRAYREAEQRGLVVGEVGRGTFVRDSPAEEADFARRSILFAYNKNDNPNLIDFKINRPAPPGKGEQLADALRTLAGEDDLAGIMSYQPEHGQPHHRAAAARWLRFAGLNPSPEEILVTNGTHHGMTVTFNTILRPGDLLATEQLTYPGVKYLANSLGLRLKPVAMDDEGMRPDALDALCRSEEVRAIYVQPTLQNPTNAIMSEERRREIARVAAEHNIMIVEDEVYGMMPKQRPPAIAAFAPDRTFYLTSVSKCMAPGLRVGFIKAPEMMINRLAATIRMTCWMTSPLNAEIVTRWLDSPVHRELTEWHQEQAHERSRLVQEILKPWHPQANDYAYHVWLHLPEPWRMEEFVTEAERRGVLVTGSDHFVVGRGQTPHAIRVCYAWEHRANRLMRGLTVLHEMLNDHISRGHSVI